MISFFDFSRTTQELWAIRKAYLEMGFTADQISLATSTSAPMLQSGNWCSLVVTWHGRSFGIMTNRALDAAELESEWSRLLVEEANIPKDELDIVWNLSFVSKEMKAIQHAMIAKGIKPPVLL